MSKDGMVWDGCEFSVTGELKVGDNWQEYHRENPRAQDS